MNYFDCNNYRFGMDIWNEIWNGWQSVLHHMEYNLIKYMI